MNITDVQHVTKGDRDFWVFGIDIPEPDGSTRRHTHIMPTDTMEWRAAEYGIEPADTATLLDLALAEPFLTLDDWETGHQLHDAPDIATARADHVARCARAKLRHRISTRAKDSPCRRVVAESPMHPEALELKRQLVARAREAHAQARDTAPHDRIAALRAAVERQGGGRG